MIKDIPEYITQENEKVDLLLEWLKDNGWTHCKDDVSFGTTFFLGRGKFRIGVNGAYTSGNYAASHPLHGYEQTVFSASYFFCMKIPNQEYEDRVEYEVDDMSRLQLAFVEVGGWYFESPDTDLSLKHYLDWIVIQKEIKPINEKIKEIWG